jgi:predicted nucleic acid-binding protein
MSGKLLLDTNLWVYLYAQNEPKALRVRQLVDEHFSHIVLSTQILGELYHVLTRKAFCAPEQAGGIIKEMCLTFPVLPVATEHVLRALEIADDYRYSYWDSLLLATASLNDCVTMYSEDMQHNQKIGKLRILNPLL